MADNRLIAIESRSIDYIPKSERGGRVWHQGPFWFAGNFVLTTLLTGFIGPALGLATLYSILAIILGVGVGTFFMAFHANQGPTMGLPQMIQSRAQFGIRGAIIPFLAVIFVYIGFNVFNVILITDAINVVLPNYRHGWYLLIIGIAVIIAIVGHNLLHRVQRLITYMMITLFILLTVVALMTLEMDSQIVDPSFNGIAFLVQLSAAAGYQISYSVYVSDYSRYLPHDTDAKKVIFWTYLGAGGSAFWLMSLGAFIASSLNTDDAIAILKMLGDQIGNGVGTIAVLSIVPSLIGIMAVNCYGAMLTSISALDAFRPIQSTVKVRIIGILIVAVVIFSIILLIPESYLESFNDFVLMMLYFLIPWTSVNLVDYYFVRKGRYAIAEIFNPNGIYGLWSKAGLIAYLLSFFSMIPFMNLSFYEGYFVTKMGGADITFIPGLLVAGVTYFLLTRSLDLEREEAVIRAQEGQLEKGEIV